MSHALALESCLPLGRPHDMVMEVKTRLEVEIDDSMMERLREEVPRRGTTVSALVETGLRLAFAEDAPASSAPENLPPLPSWDSGGHLVDIDNREELYRVMEGK